MNDKNHADNSPTDNDNSTADTTDRDVLASLRAADPAAGVEPRAGFADDVIARTLSSHAENAPSEGAAIHDLSAERERRRPRWLPWVAVAASLAIVGGAGFGLGSTAGASNVASGAAPPISLQGVNGAANPEAGIVPESNSMSGMANAKQGAFGPSRVSDMVFPGGFGRNVFSASGLSQESSTSSAFTFDARNSFNLGTVSAVSTALALSGIAEMKDGAFVLGPNDGTAPSLFVSADAALSFYYNNPTISPWNCGAVAPDVAAPDGAVTEPLFEPCTSSSSLPTQRQAIDELRAFITATGRNADNFEYGSDEWEGALTRSAQAWPVVNGQRIDQSWSLELTDAGIVSASGALAPIEQLGDYPVVSEQQAFERLSDPRFGAQMTAWPAAMREAQSSEPLPEMVTPTEPPATPVAGTPLAWPVTKVEIMSARLGLTSHWQLDGSVLFVPAYEFTDAAGGTWSVLAVADSKIDFASN